MPGAGYLQSETPTPRLRAVPVCCTPQEFSWSETELEARREDRMSSLQCDMLRHEPMFCFETSLKVAVPPLAGPGLKRQPLSLDFNPCR